MKRSISAPRSHPLAFELAVIGMALVDRDGTVARANASFCELLGYTHDELLALPAGAIVHPGHRREEMARHARLLEGAGPAECATVSYRRRDGQSVSVNATCTPVRGQEGQPPHLLLQLLAIHTDLTERRRAEKEIVLLNNLLEQRIAKRTAELEESNEDLRDFAYSLAHDLRAPLASIDGFSAQLERRLAQVLDRDSRHYLSRVRAGVKLMSDLTDGLLALADLSNTPLLHQSVDMSAVARGIAERLREQEPGRKVHIVIEETPPAQGDVRLLANMMENLLGNAWKFTSKTKRAQIVFGGQAWPNGSYLYHVKDNGAGFDPAYAYKLFGPFQRLHTASEFEGTGIGLAMVRKIVSRHGGRVWAESMPGEGATFYFSLNETPHSRAPRETGPAPLG